MVADVALENRFGLRPRMDPTGADLSRPASSESFSLCEAGLLLGSGTGWTAGQALQVSGTRV